MSIRVNFSDREAGAENVEIEPLPTGKYSCAITDVTMEECGPESKNPGKPYYAIEFTVQDGKYENRKCWTNAMLFAGALYTISKLMKALGYDVNEGEMEVPTAEELQGKTVVVGGRRLGETKDKKNPEKTYAPKFEPKNFYPIETWKGAVKEKSGSLLP